MSILIKGALLDGAVTDVYIEKKEIRQIGEDLQVQADQAIDGRRKALIPGFVNAHTHAAMTLFRGFGDDMPLMPWLEQKIWPNEAKLTREDVYWGTKLACLEMIKSGTTTFFDMYHKFRATADAVEEMGLRALLSGVCFDHFKPELAEKSKRENEKLVVDVAGYGKRIRYAIGPHAIYTVSGELLQWIHGFAAEHSVPIHLHLAETEGEVRDSVKQFGLTPVRYLYKLGILSPRLIIAHGIYVDDDEIRMLADHGVKVVHNPASNMKLASGVALIPRMLELDVPVGLAVDGSASNDGSSLLEEMRVCYLLHRLHSSAAAPTGYDVLKMATRGSARLLGRDDLGQLAPGKAADFFLVNLERLGLVGAQFDPMSMLGTVGFPGSVDYTVVGGVPVVQQGELTTMDETELVLKANQVVRRYLGR